MESSNHTLHHLCTYEGHTKKDPANTHAQTTLQGQHASTAVPPSHSSPFSLNPGASSPPNKPMQPHLRSSSAGSSAAQTPDVLAPRLCVQRVPSAVPKSAPLTTFITSLQSSLVQQQRDLYAVSVSAVSVRLFRPCVAAAYCGRSIAVHVCFIRTSACMC